MRIPLLLGLVAAGLVAFKVLTISTIVVALMVLAPLVLTFVIVGVIFFGLVSVGMLGIRFMIFCLKGFRSNSTPAMPPHPTAAAQPLPLRAGRPTPMHGCRRDWRRSVRGIGYGRRRRHFSRIWLVLGIIAVVLLVRGMRENFRSVGTAFNSHPIKIVKPPIRLGKHAAPKPVPPPIAKAPIPEPEPEIESVVVEQPAVPEPPPRVSVAVSTAVAAASSTGAGPRKAWTLPGRGIDVDDAKKEALDKAQDEVYRYLRQQNVEWMPDAFYIEERLVKSRHEDAPLKLDGDKIHQVRLEVAISNDDYRDILEHDRQYNMHQRLLGAVAILGGLLIAPPRQRGRPKRRAPCASLRPNHAAGKFRRRRHDCR